MAAGRCGPTGEAAAGAPRLRPDVAGGRPRAEGVEALPLLDSSRGPAAGDATEKATSVAGIAAVVVDPRPLLPDLKPWLPDLVEVVAYKVEVRLLRGVGFGPATTTLPRAPPPAAEPPRPHLLYSVAALLSADTRRLPPRLLASPSPCRRRRTSRRLARGGHFPRLQHSAPVLLSFCQRSAAAQRRRPGHRRAVLFLDPQQLPSSRSAGFHIRSSCSAAGCMLLLK
ncbi:hypothetical protein BS78_K191000 [Paspalum vaginatum]|uniref:Uncharacterized protein n=1 Tax=Paspalum vaginatum TaxID=158149 RepID=A0A9W8CDP7_9POAL|nr:hypothetical protein BS78_K191000 [Paspalum vaginatum]